MIGVGADQHGAGQGSALHPGGHVGRVAHRRIRPDFAARRRAPSPVLMPTRTRSRPRSLVCHLRVFSCLCLDIQTGRTPFRRRLRVRQARRKSEDRIPSLATVPPYLVTEALRKAAPFMISANCSGSSRSPSPVESTTSAKSTVTYLRSPSTEPHRALPQFRQNPRPLDWRSDSGGNSSQRLTRNGRCPLAGS